MKRTIEINQKKSMTDDFDAESPEDDQRIVNASMINVNMHTIHQFVVFVNPRVEEVIYVPSSFKHVYDYDFGRMNDIGKTVLLNSLQVYLSDQLNPDVFKHKFNEMKLMNDIYDVDLILEMIIEHGVVRKALKGIVSITNDEFDTVITSSKLAEFCEKNVKKYNLYNISDEEIDYSKASCIRIYLFDVVYEINNCTDSERDLKSLNQIIKEYYIRSLKSSPQLRIECVIDGEVYVQNLNTYFKIKGLMNKLKYQSTHI